MWKNAALLIVSTVIALVAAAAVLGLAMREPAEWKARQLGIEFDSRGRLDVILAQRKDDPNWFPAVPANTYLEHPVSLGGQRIVPLGGVANAKVVGCNEAGYYSTFTTDEAGFNNPSGTWPLVGRAHIFPVGDSFAQGDCMRAGSGIADQLRKKLDVIARVPADVMQQGGELVFVSLPEHARLVGEPMSPATRQTPALLVGVRRLGVPVIDMDPVLQRHSRAEELFPLGIKGHYNEIGYGLVAAALDEYVSGNRKARNSWTPH